MRPDSNPQALSVSVPSALNGLEVDWFVPLARAALRTSVAIVGGIVVAWVVLSATFERENKQFYADQQAFEAFRAGGEFLVQGSARSELYEDVPMDFPGSE